MASYVHACVRACVLGPGARTPQELQGSWCLPPEAAVSTHSQGPGNSRVGEGVGWEQCRKRIGRAERGNPPVGSAEVDRWGRPSPFGPWWRSRFQIVGHEFWGEIALGLWKGSWVVRVSGEIDSALGWRVSPSLGNPSWPKSISLSSSASCSRAG